MSLVSAFQRRVGDMIDALGALVACESPSSDPVATAACAQLARELAIDLIGESGEEIVVDGRAHLRWRFGPTNVVLLGHLDTVWPRGTIERWPFEVDGTTATGPGCFDMKGGVVQLLFALASLEDLDGVAVLLTTDEEIGSLTSRPLIHDIVTGAKAVLVVEPSAAGALKTQRKGVSAYRIRVIGRAAHAGLDPEKGVNAALEAAHQIHAVSRLARPKLGTTVTPSVVTVGTTTNTVPGSGVIAVDVRAFSTDELARVDRGIHDLQPALPGATLTIEAMGAAPPLPRSASATLYGVAARLADDLGLPPLGEASVGGGSDGNLTASLGIPTLDGLGAVGGNAHAEGEWLSVPAMPQRSALVAALVDELNR